MQDKFTIEQIKEALKQAEANLNFEEIDLNEIKNKKTDKQKTLKKEPKNDR